MGDEERKKDEMNELRKEMGGAREGRAAREGANFGASTLFNVYSFETRSMRAVNMVAIAARAKIRVLHGYARR